jgi:hypothetical protein
MDYLQYTLRRWNFRLFKTAHLGLANSRRLITVADPSVSLWRIELVDCKPT